MADLPFNKVCEVEDFLRPELAVSLRETYAHRLMPLPTRFPVGCHDRSVWEMAMTIRSLRHFGVLRPDATVLGAGLGESEVCFYVARHVRQFFAADRYLDQGPSGPSGRGTRGPVAAGAGLWMMMHPEDMAPVPIDAQRLVVQHMDPRRLRYPDESFDAVLWAQSSHIGNLQDAAGAAYEIGRVLKPGGILSVVADLQLAGPPGRAGSAAGRLLLSPPHLRRFVIDASGLEPVDAVHLAPSDGTLATERGLRLSTTDGPEGAHPDRRGGRAQDGRELILVRDGHVFTSCHLALRRSPRHPLVANDWAKPSLSTLGRIGRRDWAAVEQPRSGPGGHSSNTESGRHPPMVDP